MEKQERFKAAFEYLKSQGAVHSQADVAKKMQATEPNVSAALNGKSQNLTDKFLRRFNNAFDGVFNINWLTSGNGEMLNNTMSANIELQAEDGYKTILLPVAAQGGTLTDFTTSVMAYDCEKITTPIKGADYAIHIVGESMTPEYPNGSIALIKKIDEKAFINWGNVYVLDTCNGIVIKKIMPLQDNNRILCVSYNKEYPDFEVKLSDIYGMYRIVLLLAQK